MNTRAGGGGRKIRGVIIGIVTNIKDPEEIGRVKVRFPWMDGVDDPIESHWARLCGWYAGNSRGTLYVPEIGDEVLVAFEGGDPNHPYILGAVFNGEHDVPGPGNPDGKNDHKWFRSRSGHDFEFLDTDGAEKIRLVDSSQNNSVVYDTAGDTWTTEAKTGTINISAPKGYIHIDCVDFTQTTTKSRKLEVGEKHTVTVGNARTLNVDDANWVVMAGTSMTITTPQFESTTKTDVGVQAGMMVNNQGMYSTEVGKWTELQQGPVVRTAGTQTIATSAYTTVNTQGDSPAVFTLLAGALTVSSKGGVFFNGGPTTMMGGLINSKSSGAVMAKDMNGGKAALSTWLGGLLLLNPNALTFPATKLLDPIVGMDMHGPTLPAPIPPPAGPLPPLPMVPMPFAGPILIDFKATVLINFMPAAGAGATAISFHMPPLPWPWVPMSYRPILTAAIMALATAPFNAMLEMAKGKMAAMAAGSSSPTLKRGFIADFIGSSHVESNAGKVKSAGKTYSVNKGDQGQFSFTRIFPMFSSGQAFLGFLAGLLPLPVATATVNMSSPTTSVCDAPLGMMMPMGSNSCSDVPPIIPNAMPVGFSNVLTGMSIGDFLGQLAWGMVQGAATRRFQGGLRRGGNALARRIGNSNSPRLQNAAQRVNDFMGGRNCIAEGHPVDVVSGTVFTEAVDFELFGAQTATWRRFYNAKAEDMPGDVSAFGPGWRHSFDQVLIADETTDGARTLALRDDENKIVGFDLPLVDGESDFHPYLRLTLTRIDGRTYEVRDADDTVRVFRFSGGTPGKAAPPTYQPPPKKIARLVALKTPIGGEGVRLEWNRDRLVGFTDACDREVIVKHDQAGHISELRLKRSQGEDCDIFLARYRYDGDGRLIAHEDRNQNLRWYRYDRLSRLTRETDRNGYSFHFHYDHEDRCTHTYGDDNAFYCAFEYIPGCTVVGDALGGVTRYRYDDQSRVTEIHDAEGGITVKAYTEEGWLATEADPNGNLTEYAYDERGNVTQVIDPLGNATEYLFDDVGRSVGYIDALQGRWQVENDALGRVVETRTPMGRVQRLRYVGDSHLIAEHVIGDDAPMQQRWRHGQVARRITPSGVRTDFEYDATGRLIRAVETSIEGEERQVTLERDGEGLICGVNGPGTHRERYTRLPEGEPTVLTRGNQTARRRYAGWGRLVEHVDPLDRRTLIEYDLHHFVTAVTLPGGARWQYRRDRLGRTRSMQTADGRTVRFSYDPGGRIVAEERAEVRFERSFDANDNLTRIGGSDGSVFRYAYDALDRMIEATADQHRAVKRAFDADGALVTETQGDHALRWRYDGARRRVRRNTTWGTKERYQYDENGLIGMVDPAGGEHHFTHDGWGRRTTWRQAGGSTWSQTFDLRDRPVQERLIDPTGAARLERRLTWSPDATLAVLDQNDARRTRHQFRYDAANRLIGWQRNDQDEDPFELDPVGNLLRDRSGRWQYGDTRMVEDVTGGRCRYDADARLIAVDHPRGAKRLWFDHHGRLRRVHLADERVVHHAYDALGRLSETLAEQPDGAARREVYYWDGDALARRMIINHADDSITADEHYAFDPERPLLPLLRVLTPTAEPEEMRVECYTTDQRGAAIRLSDATGEAVWTGRYDPYGRCHVEADAPEQPLRLMGQVCNRTTALAHHRFRVYDPQNARFVSPDPIGLAGGEHPYAFPDDPISWADPLGLAGCNPWHEFRKRHRGEYTRAEMSAAYQRVRGLFDITSSGPQLRPGVDYNLVSTTTPTNAGGDWYQIHQTHAHAGNNPHTHYPQTNTNPHTGVTYRQRVDHATTQADVTHAYDQVRAGNLRQRQNRRDQGGPLP